MDAAKSKDWIIVGLSGITCGGKTSLSENIKAILPDCKILKQDGYFHPDDSPLHIRIPNLNHFNHDTIESLDMERFLRDVMDIVKTEPLRNAHENEQRLTFNTKLDFKDAAEGNLSGEKINSNMAAATEEFNNLAIVPDKNTNRKDLLALKRENDLLNCDIGETVLITGMTPNQFLNNYQRNKPNYKNADKPIRKNANDLNRKDAANINRKDVDQQNRKGANSASNKRQECVGKNLSDDEVLKAELFKRETTLSKYPKILRNELKKMNNSGELPAKNILIVEGFIVLNYPPVANICDLKYQFTLSKAQCWDRREKRVYGRPDVPGYFDLCVWPESIRHTDELKLYPDVVYIDGTRTYDDILERVLEDIEKIM